MLSGNILRELIQTKTKVETCQEEMADMKISLLTFRDSLSLTQRKEDLSLFFHFIHLGYLSSDPIFRIVTTQVLLRQLLVRTEVSFDFTCVFLVT